jgi:nucleotide-binding universal stress UspA family protein
MSEQRTVLVSVAMSPRAAAVAAEGWRAAQLLDARPVFLHVGVDSPASRMRLRQALVAGGAGAVADKDVLIRAGSPAGVICSAATALKAELVVLGALEREPTLTLFGSVARNVARRAGCSVLLLKDPLLQPPPPRAFVISLRINDTSPGMVRLAMELARRQGVPAVHFLHEFSITEARWLADGGIGNEVRTDDYVRLRAAAEQQLLADFLSRFDLSGPRIHAEALPGHEGLEAVHYAERQQADLLMVPAAQQPLSLWDRIFQHPMELALRRLPCTMWLYRPAPAARP